MKNTIVNLAFIMMHEGTEDRRGRRSSLDLHIGVLTASFLMVAVKKYILRTENQLYADDTK